MLLLQRTWVQSLVGEDTASHTARPKRKKKKKKSKKKKSLFLPNHFFPKLQLLCTSVLHFPQKNSQAQRLNGLLYPGAPFLLGVGRQNVAKGNLARAQVSPLTLVSAYCCGL